MTFTLDDFPSGMKNYVQQFYDKLNYPEFLERYKKHDTVADNQRPYRLFGTLINIFIASPIELHGGVVVPGYENVKVVGDLDPQELQEILLCLQYFIGIHIFDFWEIYKLNHPEKKLEGGWENVNIKKLNEAMKERAKPKDGVPKHLRLLEIKDIARNIFPDYNQGLFRGQL
jgi:hypothetical protein